MIVLSNSATQTLQPGESITFDLTKLHTGCGEYHREGSSAVKLRCKGIYELEFHANAGGAAVGTVQLQMEVGGEVLPETTMIFVEDTVGSLTNISAGTLIRNCCGDYDRVTITNTGTNAAVIAPNSAFIVKRVA